jgi:serine/threonine-protein kinase
MATSSKKSLDEIVREAQALAPDEQAAFVREACAADEALFDSVTREIASSSDSWADLHSTPGDDNASASYELAGERIGPYRVLRTLGEGGMGAVFLAERADGQFEQRVAIKLVRRGLLSRQVQNRLRIERQILATLDHPNIAKLLDGGTTQDGTPYIVMEYIDGEPIDAYCDRNELTLEERLQLFRKVCSAVHSAHQNLVVHRDLKPSNILVTRNGTPKLLDFGIAKLLDERQLMQTLAVTQADVRLMTPDHASPEQVRGDPITTASDVYVLAILLYELLTGLKPFARTTRLADLERAICELPPTAPSAAFVASARVPESQLLDLARSRRASPARLRRQLRGDLDKIVLMGLRKEPERRYASVEQFATDIDRFLQGLPVSAQADAWTYRTAKFVRRHFIVVGMSAAFVVSLIAFAIATYVQSVRIEQERLRAENVSSFMIELFRVSDPSEARGNEIRAREILDRGAARIQTELKNQPELQATLMETMAKVYLNIGLTRDAEPLVERSLAVRRQLFGEMHESVASSLTTFAELQRSKGNWDEATKLAEESLEISRRLTGENSLATALGLRNVGMVYYDRAELDRAESSLRKSLELYVRHVGEDDVQLTPALDMLARVAQARGDLAEAQQLLTRAVAIERKARGEDHPLTIERLHNLATVYQSKGDLDTAETQFRKVIALCERVLGPSHALTADASSNFAYLLQSKGKFDEAQRYYDRSIELNRRWRGERHFAVGYDLSNLGILAMVQEQLPQAEQYLRDALAIYREALAPDHPYTAGALTMLGRVLLQREQLAAAESALQEALAIWSAQYGPDSDEYAIANSSLARTWALQKRYAEAERAYKQSYPVLRQTRGADADATVRVREWIEELYRNQGRAEEAVSYFEGFAPRPVRDQNAAAAG